MKKEKMSYMKCMTCPESTYSYTLGQKGIKITCKITGNTLVVDKCPIK